MYNSNWWKSRQNIKSALDNAKKFLRGENVLPPDTFSLNNCTSSTQCGSGFSCIQGRCIKITNTPGNTGVFAGSSNDIGCGDGSSQYNECYSSTSSYGCTKTGCGEKDRRANQETCCGQNRSCRYKALPGGGISVGCNCGDLPAQGGCSSYCVNYFKANGERSSGCKKSETCNEDECLDCDSFSRVCFEAENAPCHCKETKCPNCYYCQSAGICKYDAARCKKRKRKKDPPCISECPETPVNTITLCPASGRSCPEDYSQSGQVNNPSVDCLFCIKLGQEPPVSQIKLCCNCDQDCKRGETCVAGNCQGS